nr:sugar-binding domain-containing protein [Mesorhizobium sp.]
MDVAKRLALSTATVSRLLQRARAEGIVRIEVRDLPAPDELAERVATTLTLKNVAVIEATGAGALASLAAPVGDMLRSAELGNGSVLAIGWGRAVRAVIEAGLPVAPGAITVSATGGMQQHQPHFQVNEFVRLAAVQLGGTPCFVYAPYLPAAAARKAFLSDPAIADSIALWDRVDVALVGVGLPGALATSDVPRHPQAVGDVMRHYFDAEGTLLDRETENRMISMSVDQLRRTPLVIGVAVGEAKAVAIRAAAKAKLISALVTDIRTAEKLLETSE